MFVDSDDSWDVDDRPDQEYRVELMWFAREIEINIEFSYEVFFLEVIELFFCVRNKTNDPTTL